MSRIINVNDKSNRPPRLEVYQSIWAMTHIPSLNLQWSFEEQVLRMKEAGFSGVLAFLSGSPEDEKIYKVFEREGLKAGAYCYPKSVESIVPLIKRAGELGVQFLNAQVGNYFVIDDDAVRLLHGLCEAGYREGVPVFIETHRGSVTQDLIRTLNYVEKVPDLRLTIDLSHYILAGEMIQAGCQSEEVFDALLKRTSSIHGRVSNGEQIQVNIDNCEGEMFKNFCRWWQTGMKYWADGAVSGDVLPFVVELGPIPYGIAASSKKEPGRYDEISDRWQQALLLKDTALRLWEDLCLQL